VSKTLFQYQKSIFFTNPAARVVVRREPSQIPTKKHTHEFVELVAVLSGSAIHEVDRFTYSIKPGDVYFINRTTSHAYRKPVHLNLANILIREDFIAELQPAFAASPGYHSLFTLGCSPSARHAFASRLSLNQDDLATVTAFIESMENEASRGTTEGHRLAEAWLTILVGFLCRIYQPNTPGSVPRETRFVRLISWLEQHFHEPIQISELARMAAMSERTLMRRFQETIGHSPLEYISRLRMRKARQLLERHGNRLGNEQIASLCGFDTGN
jgi:AraC-like DNA-binding protein